MSLLEPLRRRLRDHDGALTKELDRTPGGFGLGQVPARLAPSATNSADGSASATSLQSSGADTRASGVGLTE